MTRGEMKVVEDRMAQLPLPLPLPAAADSAQNDRISLLMSGIGLGIWFGLSSSVLFIIHLGVP